MTTPTPSVCLITCPVCGTEGATSNEASINKELFRLRRDLAAAQEARDQAIAIARELARLACCMDAVPRGSIGEQVAKLDALEARVAV